MSDLRRVSSARAKWEPAAPFDSSTSRIEQQTLTYDAIRDKNLPKSYRRKAASARAYRRSDDKEYTSTWEQQVELMAQKKMNDCKQRQSALSRLYCHNPTLYARTWDMWPKALPYYPTTIGAGGADMNPIHSGMSIDISKIFVPCDSLLSPHSHEYVEAMLAPGGGRGPLASEYKTGRATGPESQKHLRQLVTRRRLDTVAVPSSPKRGLSGTSARARRTANTPPPPAPNYKLGHRIDFSSHNWLHGLSFKGTKFVEKEEREGGFNNSIYHSSPSTAKSLAAHALTNNFTSPYTGKTIIDI